MSKKEIILWDLVGAGLILIEPSPVVYKNQTGGTACLESSQEGFFLPINNDIPDDNHDDWIELDLKNSFADKHRFDEKDADRLDEILSKYPETSFLSCDKLKLAESHEAWVYVKVDLNKAQNLNGFNSDEGVLTWPNSD